MESRAKILGHPAHQQLIVFPLGLLAMAVIFDIIYAVTAGTQWTSVSFYMIGAGLITGVIAAVFGVLDWLVIPRGTRAWRIATAHGVGNLIVVLLFAGSFFLRGPNAATPPLWAFVLSYCGGFVALITAWLGGELVSRLGVGVDDDADLNASNSLLTHERTGAPQPKSV